MRSQWCRQHIDETAEKCGLGEDVVSDVKRAARFCEALPEISGCSTSAILALIRISDEKVRERAISLVKKSLNVTTPTGGRKKERLTESEMKKFARIAQLEIYGMVTPKAPQPKKETKILSLTRDSSSSNFTELHRYTNEVFARLSRRYRDIINEYINIHPHLKPIDVICIGLDYLAEANETK